MKPRILQFGTARRLAACATSKLLVIVLLCSTGTAAGETFVVVNTDDSGSGSLRWAIDEANATAGLDTVYFSIPGSPPFTIQPQSPLPGITDPLCIDGTTQPGYAGAPVIEIDGTYAGTNSVPGLIATGGASTIRGLGINRFSGHGINIAGGSGSSICGCYIGIDLSGTGGLGNGLDGVFIGNDASGAAVGGLSAGDRNVISANTNEGVHITNTASQNSVLGNYIGTDATGTAPLGNGRSGVLLGGYSSDNTVGGTSAEARNVLCDNGQSGVGIATHSHDNTIIGNYIGVDVSGLAGLGNDMRGVWIGHNVYNNVVGGVEPGSRNIISANTMAGVNIEDYASKTVVMGNYIGLDASGENPLGNSDAGVLILGSSADNLIGGTTPGARNVVAGNGNDGIHITNYASHNQVIGNYVGTDVSGTVPLGNVSDGVLCGGYSSYNTIGGSTPEARNIICDNTGAGISFATSSHGNQALGNYIGVDATGTVGLGNQLPGVWLGHSVYNNTVGGTEPGSRNVISANSWSGVHLEDYATTNHVLGNYIGTDASGVNSLGNDQAGVRIIGSATGNAIGGETSTEGNLICYNVGDGIRASGGMTNALLSNAIHSNGGLGIDLGGDGVTDNDTGDDDDGPNGLQNFPALMTVDSQGGTTFIQGVLNSTPNSDFRLQFFYSTVSDPTGYGEGETLIGETDVTTDGNGNASFTSTFAGEIPFGTSVCATATDENGNTSEFGPIALTVAVELISFSAHCEGEGVLLTWATQSENDNFGFYIFRSCQEDANYIRITENPIPGAGNSAVPYHYSYRDTGVSAGETLYYKLGDIGNHGKMTMHGPVSVVVLPATYSLSQNHPNPFGETTAFRLSLVDRGQAIVKIHNMAGGLVRTLASTTFDRGMQEVVWDGTDDAGNRVAPGLYVCTSEFEHVKTSATRIVVKSD